MTRLIRRWIPALVPLLPLIAILAFYSWSSPAAQASDRSPEALAVGAVPHGTASIGSAAIAGGPQGLVSSDTVDGGEGSRLVGVQVAEQLSLSLPMTSATTTPTPGPIFPGDIEAASLKDAMSMIAGMTDELVARAFEEMSTAKVVGMIGVMEADRSAEVWSQMAPEKSGAVMEELPTDWATGVVQLVPEERHIARLPEISPKKLWEMPLHVLMDELPSVPVTHLDVWIRPEVDPELSPPVSSRPSETLTVYTLPEAPESDWALLVNSPAPLDAVLAKFNRALSNVRFLVEDLVQKPAAAPDLPADRIVNAFFNLSVENAQPGDISVAAAIIFVENSWLTANQVHKWSIEFNRFDEQRGAWIPFPSKRIREEEERVFFAVVVPGFSTLAISGSRELSDQAFRVASLAIGPESPQAGDDIEISASVTNLGSESAVYPANLWVNKTIEATQAVVVEAGQTVPFTFRIRKDEGTYRVRVERLLGEFTIGQPVAAVTPTAPATPTTEDESDAAAVALIALGVAGVALLIGGSYYLMRRRR